MTTFKIYGDYGYASQQLLEEFPLLSEAKRFAINYCKRDMGGYCSVEVLTFNEDDEVITHYRILSDDEEG